MTRPLKVGDRLRLVQELPFRINGNPKVNPAGTILKVGTIFSENLFLFENEDIFITWAFPDEKFFELVEEELE